MWWCIGAIIDKEKAMDDFAPPETTQVYIPPAAAPIIPQQPSIMSNSNQPTFQNENENENIDYLRNPSNSVYSLRNPLYEGNNAVKNEYIYFEILNIKIVDTEISVELKSGKEFTLYNIQVC